MLAEGEFSLGQRLVSRGIIKAVDINRPLSKKARQYD